MTDRKPANILTRPRMVQLFEWIKRNEEYVGRNKLQLSADAAGCALNFNVTKANIASARKALGITRPKAKPAPATCCQECKAVELARALLPFIHDPSIPNRVTLGNCLYRIAHTGQNPLGIEAFEALSRAAQPSLKFGEGAK